MYLPNIRYLVPDLGGCGGSGRGTRLPKSRGISNKLLTICTHFGGLGRSLAAVAPDGFLPFTAYFDAQDTCVHFDLLIPSLSLHHGRWQRDSRQNTSVSHLSFNKKYQSSRRNYGRTGH
jgi:hypothetical protein